MTNQSRTLIFLLAACSTGSALAGDVYKCTNPQGGIAFQGSHCPVGDTETAVHVAEPPPPPPPPSDDDVKPAEASVTGAAARPGANPLPGSTLPPMWFCTRPEDGTHYVSRDGVTQPRMVPAGILGIPAQSLASAYGSGGIGVSAPGVRRIPVNKSPEAAVAADYVAIQDICDRATIEQTCEYLHNQRDLVHDKLRDAFNADKAVLQPQQDALDDQLGGC